MPNKFRKVSYWQYVVDRVWDVLEDDKERNYVDEYRDIKLPTRAHEGDAGYDFFLPFDVTLKPGEEVRIATGVRCFLEKNKVLLLTPRSGLGSKYKMRLNNTVGVVDSGYVNSSNEGHIMATISNEGKQDLVLPKGKAFMQGIILRFSITDDDEVEGQRDGGFGSSGR